MNIIRLGERLTTPFVLTSMRCFSFCEGQKIVAGQDGKLIVPRNPIIPFIEGDGIGKDISGVARQVLDAAVATTYHDGRKIHWQEILAGEKAFAKTKSWLPDETIESIKSHVVAIKGPLTTPVGQGIPSINVRLRREMDLFACVRPMKIYTGVPTRFNDLKNLDVTIFRENREDTYSGIEFSHDTAEGKQLMHFLMRNPEIATKIPFPSTTSLGIKIASKEGTERFARAAIDYAVTHKKPSVTFLHKGNIMKKTEGAFRIWAFDLAIREFFYQVTFDPKNLKRKVFITDMITDNFMQRSVMNPERFSVVAASNLTGDLISDLYAGIVGGLGVSPGANINYETGCAIFEATHGTAPDIAGKNLANPSSLILSGKMLLEHIGWQEAAKALDSAFAKTFREQQGTGDLFHSVKGTTVLSTSDFGIALIRNL